MRASRGELPDFGGLAPVVMEPVFLRSCAKLSSLSPPAFQKLKDRKDVLINGKIPKVGWGGVGQGGGDRQ